MMNVSVPVSFSEKAYLVDGLILEQTPYGGEVGVVTKESIVGYITSLINGTENEHGIDCGMDANDAYSSTVVAYPYDRNLSYDIGISSGSISYLPKIQDREITESVSFHESDSVSLDYPIHGYVSIEWEQGPWNVNGYDIPGVSVAISGRTLTSSQKVNGTAIVKYTTVAHVYSFSIVADDSTENRFKSVVWARWDGGVEHVVLKPPPNSEEALAQGTTCFGILQVDPSDDFNPPTVRGKDETVLVDYCSNTII